MKTAEEVENLKKDWCFDPCYDLEHIEGFEDYYDELLTFRLQKEQEWKEQKLLDLETKAIEMGIPGNIKMAAYVQNLEAMINNYIMKILDDVEYMRTEFIKFKKEHGKGYKYYE
jgi:hypothetical protein